MYKPYVAARETRRQLDGGLSVEMPLELARVMNRTDGPHACSVNDTEHLVSADCTPIWSQIFCNNM
jgi:hypothetical protein